MRKDTMDLQCWLFPMYTANPLPRSSQSFSTLPLDVSQLPLCRLVSRWAQSVVGTRRAPGRQTSEAEIVLATSACSASEVTTLWWPRSAIYWRSCSRKAAGVLYPSAPQVQWFVAELSLSEGASSSLWAVSHSHHSPSRNPTRLSPFY